ncbi:Uncharacterized protein FWK35_00027371 [Aphis craccivora]|uniref:Uncharacterized protein n=1 Tax=Aphis craccivora TaxID=307492 RepID=A0A6G0ZI22_APHCR|nr:Uncharacterized protein FWK35_00027371 [Aphis craccivora]
MLIFSYFPLIWKFSTIILIHKPNKNKNEASSYRPISLLLVLAKLFEKILLLRIRSVTQPKYVIKYINKMLFSIHLKFRSIVCY